MKPKSKLRISLAFELLLFLLFLIGTLASLAYIISNLIEFNIIALLHGVTTFFIVAFCSVFAYYDLKRAIKNYK